MKIAKALATTGCLAVSLYCYITAHQAELNGDRKDYIERSICSIFWSSVTMVLGCIGWNWNNALKSST